ncbi:MAG TPA: SRPBCC domain-containing protein [Allosphingosinicella sp.]
MIFTALAFALAAAQPSPAPPPPPPPPRINLTRPFAGMQFLLGHCWQGTFADGKLDTHCFEPVYGGALIRDRHEVTGGYAGETLYNWDANRTLAEYTYWNVSGGVSRGTMREQGGLLDFGDEVYRGRDGRETRIATIWRRIDDTSYEVRVTSAADPTGSRVTRYVRQDAAPVRVEEVRAPDGSTNLSHELVVAAPIERVYAALSTAEGWRGWAVPNAWAAPDNPDLMETSYSRDGRQSDPRNIRQLFLLRVPNRLIAFRTVAAPPGFPHAEAYYRVTSLFELSPAGPGTRVRLTGIGYPAGEAGQTLLGFFREGNLTTLEELRRRLAGEAASNPDR